MPVFIKIDVEGFEKEVLSGLTKRINTLSFEYCVPEQLQQAIDCINILAESNPSMKFNFSIGESMEFNTDNWLPASEMIEFMNTAQFINTGFGDVYGKNFN
jgi:hypothetical protein